jgi:hypothetical protein
MKLLRRKLLVALFVILALLVPLAPGFDQPGLSMDEGALLVYPELVLKGHVPYRDFETFYGPANVLVLSGVYSLVGPNIFVERTVGLLYRLLVFGAFFVLIQRWSTTLAAGCLLLAGLLFIPLGIPAFAWIGAVACALWSIWMISKIDSARSCFFGGVLGSFALLFRPDLALAMVASGLPLFLLMPRAQRGIYLAGVTCGLLPLAFLTVIAGYEQVLNNLFLFPVFHCSAGRRLPIFAADNYLISLFFIDLIAVLTNIGAGLLAVRQNRQDVSARLLLSLALLGLGLTHQATQRFDFGHLVSAALLSITVLPVSIFILRSHFRDAAVRESDALLACALVLVLLLAVAPELSAIARSKIIASFDATNRGPIFVQHRGRSFPVGSPQDAVSLDQTLAALEHLASPGDRLFVGPADLRRTNYNDTFIYHLLPQLQPATYFLEMNPLSANRPNSRLAADIAQADWLVLTHHWDNWNEPNDSMKFGSDAPMEVVRNNFDLCGRYENYDLYRRRSPVALRN